MSKNRRGGRDLRSHRVIDATVGFHRLAEGSVLYRSEGTVILVTASVDESVPRFMEGSGRGWVTAEYQLHPRANPQRREARDGRLKPVSGRSKEIERLIGRALRGAVIPERLGERTIVIDCDVLEADGGTRTASITAGWIALVVALERLRVKGLLTGPPLRDQVAAISVGHVDGELALDLCYAEDSVARVDLNVVGTEGGSIVELQGTAEGEAVSRAEMDAMIDLALLGVMSLCDVQRELLKAAGIELGSLLAKRG
ncbi:MAG TPA: ribonuclease PH [Polyangiaceae bacterium]|jgi:ribonuclease PH|nr:ribonuclease PH [Polyangiaceae bacterium]